MSELKEAFIKTQGDAKDLRAVKSLLRICPIGAHSDYQNGRVTGMTLDATVAMVYAPRETILYKFKVNIFLIMSFFHMYMIQNI